MRWLAQKRSWRACACSGKSCWQGTRRTPRRSLPPLPSGTGHRRITTPRKRRTTRPWPLPGTMRIRLKAPWMRQMPRWRNCGHRRTRPPLRKRWLRRRRRQTPRPRHWLKSRRRWLPRRAPPIPPGKTRRGLWPTRRPRWTQRQRRMKNQSRKRNSRTVKTTLTPRRPRWTLKNSRLLWTRWRRWRKTAAF